MSRLKKPYWRKTEVGIEVTIRRDTPRGKGRIMTFNKPVKQIQLSPVDAHMIGWHLDPKSHLKGAKN